MKNLKVAAFDCDGVIFDTEQSNREYYNHILAHFGKPLLTAEQFAYVHMHTLEQSLAYLFKDEESLLQAQAYRKSMNYREFLNYMKLEPDLVPLLQKMRPRIKAAIATNRTDTMNWLLDEFELSAYFDFVVTSTDVKFPKPQPDPLLKIVDYFKIEPHQAIYVGDSQVDQIAARSAGVTLVAYRNRELDTDYHIESLRELEEILEL
jgi:HAD superfamily hydrolase (TIGR01509 family)